MRVLRCATVGAAIALGATSAYAQSVISRTIDNAPVETTVTQGPAGTVVTRRPLAGPVASDAVRVGPAAYMDETVGAAPTTRTTTRTTTRIVHHRQAARTRRVTRTVRTVRRIGPPLLLDPAQRRIVYRTIVQEQVVPPLVAPAVPLPPPGYPPYPAPAYSSATTGYAVTTPVAEPDDVYTEEVPAAAAYPVRYTIGSRLPAGVALTPLPVTAAIEVPAVRPYSYVTIGNRVLLVDPATNAVVADITP